MNAQEKERDRRKAKRKLNWSSWIDIIKSANCEVRFLKGSRIGMRWILIFQELIWEHLL